jgi:hypothetical protein
LWNPLCKLFNYESIISPYWCHWGFKQEMTNLFTKHTFGPPWQWLWILYCSPWDLYLSKSTLFWHLEMEGSKNAPLLLYSGKAFRKLVSLIMGNLDFLIDILYFFALAIGQCKQIKMNI